jgi:hypothetical protein
MNTANEIIDKRINDIEKGITAILTEVAYHKKEIQTFENDIKNQRKFIEGLKQLQVDILQAEMNQK